MRAGLVRDLLSPMVTPPRFLSRFSGHSVQLRPKGGSSRDSDWFPLERYSVCALHGAARAQSAGTENKSTVAFTVDTNAFPPHVLLVRGTAAIDIVDGVPPEYFAASRKGVGPDQWDTFEAQVRAMYKQMARIKITPLWAKLLDFQTRFPTPIEKLIRRAS